MSNLVWLIILKTCFIIFVDASNTLKTSSGNRFHLSSRSGKFLHELDDNGVENEDIQQLVDEIKDLTKMQQNAAAPFLYKVQNGKAKKAADDFLIINDASTLKYLIQTIYKNRIYEVDEQKVQEKIVQFLKHLSRISLTRVGFYKLQNVISESENEFIAKNLCDLLQRLNGPINGIDTDLLEYDEIQKFYNDVDALRSHVKEGNEC